jgi:hypothetical protein
MTKSWMIWRKQYTSAHVTDWNEKRVLILGNDRYVLAAFLFNVCEVAQLLFAHFLTSLLGDTKPPGSTIVFPISNKG